jgi:3-isopropylmalate/(R)-2-methylmalate dehydratase large subunit
MYGGMGIMGKTITEKIIGFHSGLVDVHPGQFVNVKIDLVFIDEITGGIAIDQFKRMGAQKVFDAAKVVVGADHYIVGKDVKTASDIKKISDFAREYGILNYFDSSKIGIFPAFLPEKGLVAPGEIVIGTNSHTCQCGALGALATGVGSTDGAAAMALGEIWLRVPETIRFEIEGKRGDYVTSKDIILHIIGKIGVEGAHYRTMEFTGEVVRSLSIEERETLCNMAVEAGAKFGIVPPDKVTFEYLKNRVRKNFNMTESDMDAHFSEINQLDVSGLRPMVAVPFSPSNTLPVDQLDLIKIDQVFIGSCTNGNLIDLEQAARILKGNRVAKGVRLIIIPATKEAYDSALRLGLLEIFSEAGGNVFPSNCGPCAGLQMGALAEGEICVSTTNRNFKGRMGHPDSKIYLANPYVAAASAILGKIADPKEVLK